MLRPIPSRRAASALFPSQEREPQRQHQPVRRRRRRGEPALLWQVRDGDLAVGREDDRALDPVLELAHVARPVVCAQHREDVPAEDRRRPAIALRVHVGEVTRELLDLVPATRTERRDLDLDDANSIVEVLAELPVGHEPLEILVGRADDANVAGHRLASADR